MAVPDNMTLGMLVAGNMTAGYNSVVDTDTEDNIAVDIVHSVYMTSRWLFCCLLIHLIENCCWPGMKPPVQKKKKKTRNSLR